MKTLQSKTHLQGRQACRYKSISKIGQLVFAWPSSTGVTPNESVEFYSRQKKHLSWRMSLRSRQASTGANGYVSCTKLQNNAFRALARLRPNTHIKCTFFFAQQMNRQSVCKSVTAVGSRLGKRPPACGYSTPSIYPDGYNPWFENKTFA